MTRLEIDIAPGGFLHSQPAAELVRCACEFAARVRIVDGKKYVNAKSMMGVLSLGTPDLPRLTLETDGSDEREAIEKLAPMVQQLFRD